MVIITLILTDLRHKGLNLCLQWFKAHGYNKVSIWLTSNITTYDSVIVPINMTLNIAGSNMSSAGQKTWQRVGAGGDSPALPAKQGIRVFHLG